MSQHRGDFMVQIIPYQGRWPGEFREIAADLRNGLGNLALRIDHIGSTSVPGLAAKDIIDVQISVEALNEPVKAAMEALGYTQPEGIWRDHCPPTVVAPETEWEKWIFKLPAGQRPFFGRRSAPATIVRHLAVRFDHCFINAAPAIRNGWGWGLWMTTPFEGFEDDYARFGFRLGNPAGYSQSSIHIDHC